MQRDKSRFYLVLFAFLTLFVSAQTYGQDEPPVQINMDVLNAINPAAGAQNYYSTPVPAPATPRKPSLTKRDFVSFPVTIKDRTERRDPSLKKTPAYVDKPAEKKPAINVILPDFKPVKIVKRKPKVKVPVPPRRPVALIKEAPPSDLSIGGMIMPAVPPQVVQAETLSPPKTAKETTKIVSNDPLTKQLIVPNRQAMVTSIEAIAALADALMPATSVTSSTPIQQQRRPQRVKISYAPIPARKPKMANSVIAEIEQAISLDSIEPTAGTTGIKVASLVDITEAAPTQLSKKRIPRNPPENGFELEYISLPFSPGTTALDEDVTGSLNQDIIPLLKNNPQWRLQIQAFAGKTDDSLKNARRTSLSRALSIRSHLLDQGIEARRMDVRALGMQTDRNPVDRVDFVFFDPAQK